MVSFIRLLQIELKYFIIYFSLLVKLMKYVSLTLNNIVFILL